MSAPAPKPKPQAWCDPDGTCWYSTTPECEYDRNVGWKCQLRKKREAEAQSYYIPGFGGVYSTTPECKYVNGKWQCILRKKREAEPEPREKREAWGPGDVNCVPDYGYNCE